MAVTWRGGVLATRAPGVVMRAYRQANRMTQQQLADLLGYDRTYISMIECGRRAITDRETLTRIARKLAIPPHALGVAEPDDGDFTSMMEFGASVIRLAEVARHSGRAAEAVNELWPLITGLETRIAAGHAEHQVLILLTHARAAFGIALGHLLPDEQVATAARWTGKALRIAQHIGDRQLLAYVLRMHGNELRKAGHPSAGAMTDAGGPSEFAHEDGRQIFALAEIMVRKAWTGQGIAHALHNELLAIRAERCAELYVRPDNTTAYRAYLKWGWHRIRRNAPGHAGCAAVRRAHPAAARHLINSHSQ